MITERTVYRCDQCGDTYTHDKHSFGAVAPDMHSLTIKNPASKRKYDFCTLKCLKEFVNEIEVKDEI